MPLILALSPTLCPMSSGREGPHLLLYFRPFSNYTLTLVIYIMSLIPKRQYWRCWEVVGMPVPACPQLGRLHLPVTLVQRCWSSSAASQHLAAAPLETALEGWSQVSQRGSGSRTTCQKVTGDGLSRLQPLDVLRRRHNAPPAACVARGSVPCPCSPRCVFMAPPEEGREVLADA